MSNKDFIDNDRGSNAATAKPPATGKRAGTANAGAERTVDYPGLPGKAQPRDRSNGIKGGRFQIGKGL